MTLLDVFAPAAEEQLRRVRSGLGGSDALDDLVRAAHTLKGGAATVGLLRAASLAEELEGALGRGDRTAAGRALEVLAAELDAVPAGIRTVVYVDDDPSSRLLAQRVAARVPRVRLLTARTGRDGLEAVRLERPDLVLLDSMLPDLDGEDVLRCLGADPATADVPVTIVSADAQAERIAELRAAGATAYLVKPLDVDQLRAILEGVT